MKKIFAAAALATVIASPALAAKDEPMVPVEFAVTTNSAPAMDAEGNLVLDEDGAPKSTETKSFQPKLHVAPVCMSDSAGNKFTVAMAYMLVASAPDLGIDPNQENPDLNVLAEQIGAKMPQATLDKANAYILEALNKSLGQHKLEELAGTASPQSLVADIAKTFTDVIEDKRLDETKPSFQ
jgi:opacity protein-like surface antigen